MRTFRLDTLDGMIDAGAVIEADWDKAKIRKASVAVPVLMLTGARKTMVLPFKYILNECEAPSVEEYVARKQRRGQAVN
jgi:hypothetical protein